ncbi:MAG: hypothetical protein KF887_19740 [Paracoccaceae bacterium]|nr:MAG: hypothetical protein KF887_19740 [Paracoccaceae bacterium]
MSARPVLQNSVRLVLTATGPMAEMVADILTAHLGLPAGEAARRLAGAQPVIAEGLPRGQARRVAALLSVIGARARIEGHQASATDPRRDIALHPRGRVTRTDTLQTLAHVAMRPPRDLARDLASPSGLVITGLTLERVGLWQAAMPRLTGLRLILSDPATARYDLIPLQRPADPAAPAALARQLARLGTRRCAMTCAIAADLDRATCDHLMRRFPGSGAAPVNRDFQRFDLMLEGAEGLSDSEVSDFLITRGGAMPGTVLAPGAGSPMCIERGLPRAQALAFQAEYAAIGLRTRARLCGLGPA